MNNHETPRPMESSAYMSLENYERAIAASTEKDKDGNPIPNFEAVQGAMLVIDPDGSARIIRRQREPEKPIHITLQNVIDAINQIEAKKKE